jgi:hypothetical protein
MRTLSVSLFAAVIAFGTSAVSAQAPPRMTKDQLLGTWRLIFWKTTANGHVAFPLGEHPGGFAEYTPRRAFFMLVDPSRKAPASATLTDAEAGSLMKSSVAYTGKYDVDPAQTPDGVKVTIHVDAAASEAINGTERVFFERVDGNEMIVKSPLALVPTTGLKSAVELHYVKAE